MSTEKKNETSRLNNRGFSMVELMVTLAIIALVGAIIYPALGNMLEKSRVEAAVRDVATMLKFSRETALAEQEVVAVILRKEEADLTIFRKDKVVRQLHLPRGVTFSRIVLEDEEETGNSATLWYYPDGRVTGVALVIKQESGRLFRLKSDLLTGNIHVYKPGEKGYDDAIFTR